MKIKLKKAIAPMITLVLCVAVVAALAAKSTEREYETRWFTAEEADCEQTLSEKLQNMATDQEVINQTYKTRDKYLKIKNPSDYEKELIASYDRSITELESKFELDYGVPANSELYEDMLDKLSEERDSLGTTEPVEGVDYVFSRTVKIKSDRA